MGLNAQTDSTGAVNINRRRRMWLSMFAALVATVLGLGVHSVANAATNGVTALDQSGIGGDGFAFDAGSFYKVEAVRVTRITNTDQGETHLFTDWYAGLGWDESAYNAGPQGNEFAVNVFSGPSATGPWTGLGTFFFSKDASTTTTTSTTPTSSTTSTTTPATKPTKDAKPTKEPNVHKPTKDPKPTKTK